MQIQPGDLLVARAWSWKPEVLKRKAALDLQEQIAEGVSTPKPSISVYAMRMEAGMQAGDLVQDLCDYVASKLNSKYVGFTTSSRLKAQGFDMELNEPPEHHYDIFISDLESDQEIAALSHVFDEEERKKLDECRK